MNTDHVVASTNDLSDGQMKEVEVGDRTILLVRVDGSYKAYVSECPHHGASLADGLLHQGRIRCPWHQALFDARKGKLIEPPALDGLPHYDVRVEDDKVIVAVPSHPPESRQPRRADRDAAKDPRTFVIVGSGAAGCVAAETLREEGFRGRIAVLTAEECAPYDRTELSKRYLADPEASWPLLRPKQAYDDWDIEVLTGHEVTAVDTEGRKVSCGNGETIGYDKLLLATGSVPRTLGVDGEDLANIFALRRAADADAIRNAVGDAARAVVVGASFIGMETAAALSQRGLEVTVVAPEAVPFEATFGERIGRMLQAAHEAEGTAFRMGAKVDRFEGSDGRIRRVVLDGGDALEADLVIVGVGVRPATDFLDGLAKADDGSLIVDAHLRAAPDVHAAGDAARFPDWRTGEPIRIEHWRLAEQLGRVAARNMLERDVPYAGVPFFWTSQHGVIADMIGCAGEWDDVVFEGAPDEQDFLAWYVKDGRALAAAACGRSRQADAAGEVLGQPTLPTLDEARRQVDRMVAAQHSG